MTVSVSNQIFVFLSCVLLGMILGLLFDVFRIVRRTTPAGTVATATEDMLFWLLAALLVFLALLFLNDGQSRIFEWLGIAIGGMLYLSVFSRLVIAASMHVIHALKTVFRWILFLLLFPVRLLFRILKKPMIRAISPLRITVKRTKRMVIKAKRNTVQKIKSFQKRRKKF